VRTEPAHRVVIVIYPFAQSLDLCGPADVFDAATRLGATRRYRIETVSVDGGPVEMSNGLTIQSVPMRSIRGRIDTLMVVGGLRVTTDYKALVNGVLRLAGRSDRVTSVCTGAVVLAAAGLLDNRRVTTHWAFCEQLQDQFPAVVVEPSKIWVNDGHIWTSAGVTAGMDLALALVTADCGGAIARDIGRWLVMYLHRPGGQSQFSDQLVPQGSALQPLSALLEWIEDNLERDLSVQALATQAAMSPRQLLRHFQSGLSTTPANYVLSRRLTAARSLIETTSVDLASVGRQCGFRNVETMHRAFRRQFGTTPGRHRELFATPGAQGWRQDDSS
jgi:transcriptional regulator GlxA family with amidase domain